MNTGPKNGFTLIEVMIYIALFGILIGGGVVAAFNILEASGRAQTHAMLEQEGNFIMSKVAWAVSGAYKIDAPSGTPYGSALLVSKVTGLDASGNPITTDVHISLPDLSAGEIRIQNGNHDEESLNNSNVIATNLGFYHTLGTGNGLSPEMIEASTTLTARTPSGMVVTEDFTTTVYVRR